MSNLPSARLLATLFLAFGPAPIVVLVLNCTTIKPYIRVPMAYSELFFFLFGRPQKPNEIEKHEKYDEPNYGVCVCVSSIYKYKHNNDFGKFALCVAEHILHDIISDTQANTK